MRCQTHPMEVCRAAFKVANRYELKTNPCTERNEKGCVGEAGRSNVEKRKIEQAHAQRHVVGGVYGLRGKPIKRDAP